MLPPRLSIKIALNSLAWAAAVVSLAESLRANPAEPSTLPPGMRKIAAAHLTLFTDLPASAEIDALPALFDQAFGQWCAYFEVDPREHATWHIRGCLMKSRERFEEAGLLPHELANFQNGYASGGWLWLYDQTSPYYRRHLLLHEGTHAFMNTLLGGVGPPWYSEAMAELLATHRLESGSLTLNYFPRTSDEVSKWGRIEIVQTGYEQRHALSLARIFAYDQRAHLENEAYGWCWAAAAFLDGHPRYRERFRKLYKQVTRDEFASEVERTFSQDRPSLNEDWQLYVANLDYGYDFQRMDVDYVVGKSLPTLGANLKVAADRGWQNSGVRIDAGTTLRLRASGRYQLAREPKPWECEPGGVTIRYYHGQPLGILLAAVRDDESPEKGASGLLQPLVVGLETTHAFKRSGTLYFRVNDSAGSLADNAGSLSVEITRETAARARSAEAR